MTDEDLRPLLNDEQWRAAVAPDGPLLILAAAGTGKTRTLVYRLVHLIGRGVDPRRILLLTFTNRAAREMIDRTREATGGFSPHFSSGTFHHCANWLLRKYGASLGIAPDFAVLDAEDQRGIMGRILKDRGHRPKDRDFPKREVVLSLLSGAVNRNLDPADWIERKGPEFSAQADELLACMREYDRRKRELGALDFDDLLVRALRLLREDARVRELVQEHFEHVLVDEYQDTNALQSSFVDLVAARHRNLSVVGDDFQCIYSWRGSDYNNIMSFADRYPDARVVKLETNYRSLGPILDLANASIRNNREQFARYAKVLRPARESGGAPRPRLVEVHDGDAQADELVDAVRTALRRGFRPCEIAVLYRSHFHAMEAELALTKLGIPYRITSGTGFYEQKHVKDAVSLLRLAATPDDALSFLRVMELLPAVGDATAERLWERLGRRFDPSDPAACEALLDALPARARAAWRPVGEALGAFGRAAFPGSAKALLDAFLDSFYRDLLRKEYETPEEREDDLGALEADIAKYESLRAFLDNVALLTNLDREGGPASGSAGASPAESILLSTIHQAKGLEWPVVILLWCVEGMFPSSRSLDDQGGDEEERRLFYVAVTRARESLTVFRPHVRTMADGGVMPCTPSRFLKEVPADLFERVDRTGGFDEGYSLGWNGGWGGGYGRGGGYGGRGGYRLRSSLFGGVSEAPPSGGSSGGYRLRSGLLGGGGDDEPTFGPGGARR